MHMPADVRTYQARARGYTGTRGPWLEHMVEDCGCTLEEAQGFLAPYECIPIIDERNGHMATVIKRNKEIHLAIYRRFRHRSAVSLKRIKTHLEPLLQKEGFLVTKVSGDDDIRFIEHLGFERMGATMEGFKTFILNAIKYPGHKHAHL